MIPGKNARLNFGSYPDLANIPSNPFLVLVQFLNSIDQRSSAHGAFPVCLPTAGKKAADRQIIGNESRITAAIPVFPDIG
jgi:hypothetical protein